MLLRSITRRVTHCSPFFFALAAVSLLHNNLAFAAAEECTGLPAVLSRMATNSAGNQVLYIRPGETPPDVCITNALVEERAALGSPGFVSCDTVDGQSWGLVVPDVNRGQVLWYKQGRGEPSKVCSPDFGDDCGTKPNHVAVNTEDLVAIADEQGRIGFFKPNPYEPPVPPNPGPEEPEKGGCGDPLTGPVFTDPLRLTGGGPPVTIREIADLEFSDQIGGNFGFNDLLVLTRSPERMLLLIRAGDSNPLNPEEPQPGTIVEFLKSGDQPDLEILLEDSDFTTLFGPGAVPTSLTVTPGTGGLGLVESTNRSPVVLLGVNTPDLIAKLRFDGDGINTICAEGYTSCTDGILDVASEITPQTLDAGRLVLVDEVTLEEEVITILLISTNNGRIYDYRLAIEGSAPDEGVVSLDDFVAPITIADDVQNPGGAEVLDDWIEAGLCYDKDAEETETGCNIGPLQLHISALLSGDRPDGATVSLQRVLWEDTDARRNQDGEYELPTGNVPAWCRGILLPDAADNEERRVLVELRVSTTGLDLLDDDGENYQWAEQLEKDFPEVGSCPDYFGDMLYIEDPEDREFYPPGSFASNNKFRSIQHSCNRSRGTGPSASTLVLCSHFIQENIRSKGGIKGKDKKAIEPLVEERLSELELFVLDLPQADEITDVSGLTLSSDSLRDNLLGLIEAARDSATGGNPDFLEAARYTDLASVMVYRNKQQFKDATLDYNAYGVLLSGFVSTSYFFAQVLTLPDDLKAATGGTYPYYCAPQELVQPVLEDPTTPELRDITCTDSLPPIEYP
jgi:hypothetical protein